MIYQTNQPLQRLSFLLAFLAISLHLAATTTDFDPWTPIAEQQFASSDMERQIIPFEYETFHLQINDLQSFLAGAPERYSEGSTPSSYVLVLPMPNGEMERFEVVYAPVIAPKLADKYPMIRSYAGYGIDDPTASLRFDVTQFGFHAMVLSARHSTVFIDPYAKGVTDHYITYYTNDYVKPNNDFVCNLETDNSKSNADDEDEYAARDLLQGDCRLRTYRLALTCTGEYANFHGGTVASVLAAMNTTMTRVNGVFERDINANMVIVDDNEDLIFLNAGSDPYNNNNAGQMIGECHDQCVAIIGSANFDIGHIFTTGGGGLAGLGVICRANSKGEGVTGIGAPVGDPFDIDYVAHEMGHQFGANHTFNNSCGFNRNDATAVEPGSASTIMGYAGICGPNVQNNSDDYFHAISIQEMSNYINNSTGDNCASYTDTGNTPPTVEDLGSYTLPVSTPFRLTAVGEDADENVLTYCWEQMDVQIATMPPVSTNTGGPAFRSFDPTENPTRYFPRLSNLVNNTTFQWETLPSVSRSMNFRVTVRDNNMGSGCTIEDDLELQFTNNAGPFLVESPNTNVIWIAGFPETVTWDVANTDAAPVSCANVDILLSTDGGFTYPVTLASGVPNTGSYDLIVPVEITNTARVMVVCSDNVFFDISNQNFIIEMPAGPSFSMIASPSSFNVCGTLEESVDVALELTSLVGFDEVVTLTVAGLPAGATIDFSDNDIVPTANSTLTIGNLPAVANGTYDLTVIGTSESELMEAAISLTVSNGSPATATLSSPENGATNQIVNTVLNWDAIDGVNSYTIEIATSPGFGDAIVETATVETNSYTAQNLASNGVYYWRVKGTNICGESDFGTAFSFQTFVASCVTYTSTDTPLIISATGAGNTVNSFIPVNENLILTEVTVSMGITHSWVGDLNAILTPPAGSSINLFDRPGYAGSGFGCGEDDLSLIFDDEASNTADDLENTCNTGAFAIQGTYQPIEQLAELIGENPQGDWELEVSDAEDQDGGSLDTWSLELCFAVGNSEVLDLINNTWTVASGGTQVLPNSNLVATSSASTAEDITFVVLSLPTEGNLTLNGMPVMVGTTFTQADIDNGILVYTNTNNSATEDQFDFDVLTTGGQWLPNQTFNITFGTVTISAAAIVTAGVLCNGNMEGEVTVNVSGTNPPFSYSLNGGDPTGSNVFSNLPAGSYTVTVLNANEDAITTNTVTIEEPESIVASANNVDNDVTIDATGGTGTLLYSIDGVSFQDESTFPNLDNGDYTFTIMDENGCTSEVMISINLIVSADVLTSPATCDDSDDGSLEITAVTGGVEPYEYSIGNDFVSSGLFTDLTTGIYMVTILDANGDSFDAGSYTISAPEFTAIGNVVENNITVSTEGGVGTLQYSIDGGDTFQASNEFNSLANGDYVITVMDENGCTATTSEITIDLVGLFEISFDLEFRLFPNPAQNMLTLELNQATGRTIQIQVFDVAGRLVQSTEMDKTGNYLKATLDVEELPAGSYEILLTDGSMLGKARFVKM